MPPAPVSCRISYAPIRVPALRAMGLVRDSQLRGKWRNSIPRTSRHDVRRPFVGGADPAQLLQRFGKELVQELQPLDVLDDSDDREDELVDPPECDPGR